MLDCLTKIDKIKLYVIIKNSIMYSSTYTLAAIVGAILAISAVLMWFIYAVFQIMFWSEVLDKHRAWKVPIWIAIGIFTMLLLGVVLLPLKWSLVTFIPVIVQFVCLGNLCDFAKAFGLKKSKLFVLTTIMWGMLFVCQLCDTYRIQYLQNYTEMAFISK